jgi:hypothetical protein
MESKSRMVVNMDFGEKEILFFDGYKVLVKWHEYILETHCTILYL